MPYVTLTFSVYPLSQAFPTFWCTEAGDKLKTKRFSNDPRSQWVIDKKKIVNRTGQVLDIRGEKEGKGAELCAFQYKGAPNQHWRIDYVWASAYLFTAYCRLYIYQHFTIN